MARMKKVPVSAPVLRKIVGNVAANVSIANAAIAANIKIQFSTKPSPISANVLVKLIGNVAANVTLANAAIAANIKSGSSMASGTGLISQNSNVSLGNATYWVSNVFSYIAHGQANVKSDSLGQDFSYNANTIVWQLFYAHRPVVLKPNSGKDFRWSLIAPDSGSNPTTLYGVISTRENFIGAFNSNVETLIGSTRTQQYSANTLFQGNVNTRFSVPAKRYFMLGFSGGPLSKNFKRTSNTYTVAVNTGDLAKRTVLSVLPNVYVGSNVTGPLRGVPTQVGGNTSNYIQLQSNILLAAIKFEI